MRKGAVNFRKLGHREKLEFPQRKAVGGGGKQAQISAYIVIPMRLPTSFTAQHIHFLVCCKLWLNSLSICEVCQIPWDATRNLSRALSSTSERWRLAGCTVASPVLWRDCLVFEVVTASAGSQSTDEAAVSVAASQAALKRLMGLHISQDAQSLLASAGLHSRKCCRSEELADVC